MAIFTADKFAEHVLARGAAVHLTDDTVVIAAYGDVQLCVIFDSETGRFLAGFKMNASDGFQHVCHIKTIKTAVDTLGLPGLEQMAAA